MVIFISFDRCWVYIYYTRTFQIFIQKNEIKLTKKKSIKKLVSIPIASISFALCTRARVIRYLLSRNLSENWNYIWKLCASLSVSHLPITINIVIIERSIECVALSWNCSMISFFLPKNHQKKYNFNCIDVCGMLVDRNTATNQLVTGFLRSPSLSQCVRKKKEK